jgi:carbamate kinase
LKIVLALGGNALLQRGAPQDVGEQRRNVDRAATQIALIARASPPNALVLTHGNGPQVGLLALQAEAYTAVAAYPLDVLGAESEGMVGYLLEQALQNRLPGRVVATLLTRTEVRRDDPAFASPTKPIGPMYGADESVRIAKERGWTMAADGTGFRRVVPSPAPVRVISQQAIAWLLQHGAVVIAAGGGGVPVAPPAASTASTATTRSTTRLDIDVHALEGVEAVIDKDAASSLLARGLDADCLLIATDVRALYLDWGKPTQRAIERITPRELGQMQFAAGSMGPKVKAACDFVIATGRRAVIGSLDDSVAMLSGGAGTQIVADAAR